MPIEKGEFILVNYNAKVKETGEVYDTTEEVVAKREKIYKEGELYEPKLIVVGEGWMLKPLDEALLKFEVNKKDVIEIPSEKAFGPRDPEKVKRISLRRLTTRGITPQLGMRIEYDGKPAVVRTIGSGRVQLDFNPPLAGKTLVYEVAVEKKLERKADKIAALIHRRIPTVDIVNFNFKIRKTSITVEVPEEAFYVEGLQLAKRGIAMDIHKFFPETSTIKFTETFKRK